MNATKRSISAYLIFTIVASLTAQQDSISIDYEHVVSDGVDSSDVIVSKIISKNNPLTISDSIPTIFLIEDKKTIIELSNLYSFVSYPDEIMQTIKWNFLEGKNTSFSFINNQLEINPYPNWYGLDTISIIISDSSQSDTSFIPVSVSAINDPPIFFSQLDTITLNEDEKFLIDINRLESIINDIDNSVNELKWSTANNHPFQSYITNNEIKISIAQNWFGNESIQIIASDTSLSDTLDVYLKILPVNDPPIFIDKLPSATINEDEILQMAFIDWKEYVSDVDNSDESLFWNAIEGQNIKLTIYENSMTLKSIINWSGIDTIMISINDGEHTDSIDWIIKVNPVNDPPQFKKKIFTYKFYEDDILSINKNHIILEIDDPDDDPNQLELTIANYKNIILNETENDFFLQGKKDWFGNDSLILTVSDSETSDHAKILIQIIPVNDPPIFIDNLPDTSLYEDGSISYSISKWYNRLSDPDDEIESLKWTVNTANYIDIIIDNEMINIKSLDNWYGNETIHIIASDQELSDTTKIIISVLPVNDFPSISYIPPIILNEDEKIDLQLNEFVHDKDDHDSLLTWSVIKNYKKNDIYSFNNSLYNNSRRYLSTFLNQEYLSINEYETLNIDAINWVTIDSKYQQINIEPPPNYFGKNIPILLQVKDPFNAKDIKLLSITIEPVNDAPSLSNIPTIFMNEDESLREPLNIWKDYVVDIDDPFSSLQWQIISLNKWINYDVSNNEVLISPEKDWFGKDTITVSVFDKEYSDSTKVIIEIASQNDPPESFELIDNVIEDSTKFTFQWYPTIDIDNDTIEYHFYLKGSNIDTVIYGIVDKYSFTFSSKTKLKTGAPYLWYVTATDKIDTVLCEKKLTFFVKTLPQSFALHQNYPNPFNRNTKIPIDMLHGDALKIVIYDMHGKQIKTLSDEFKTAGKYEIEWDGTDRFGKQVSTGVYLAIMQTRNFSQARKIMFIK